MAQLEFLHDLFAKSWVENSNLTRGNFAGTTVTG